MGTSDIPIFRGGTWCPSRSVARQSHAAAIKRNLANGGAYVTYVTYVTYQPRCDAYYLRILPAGFRQEGMQNAYANE